jgi:hypothetical protein
MCLLSVLKGENQVKGAKILGYRTDLCRNASDAGQHREVGVPEMLPVVGEALLAVNTEGNHFLVDNTDCN